MENFQRQNEIFSNNKLSINYKCTTASAYNLTQIVQLQEFEANDKYRSFSKGVNLIYPDKNETIGEVGKGGDTHNLTGQHIIGIRIDRLKYVEGYIPPI